MAKFQSPLLGYNNNVRHKNRQFHIQTEDSGVNHPHIITHLFMDGGRILKSVKKSYAEHVGVEGMSDIVRGLMKEQHKAMFIALRDGQFDHLVDPVAAAAAAAATAARVARESEAPAAAAAPVLEVVVDDESIEAPSPVTAPVPSPIGSAPSLLAAAEPSPNTIEETRPRLPRSAPPPSVAHAKVAPLVPPPPSSPDIAPLPYVPAVAEIDAERVPTTTRQAFDEAPAPSTATAARSRTPSGRELTLDFDALDQAAQEGASPSLFHSSDLPPPPKNLFAREPGTGAYRAVEADSRHEPRDAREVMKAREGRVDPREEPPSRSRPGAPPPSTRGEPSPKPSRASTRVPAARPGTEARYAPARPAAIFGSTQRPPPQSLFNDELVSDKSLDEVILSYLAEDLEPPRRK